MEEEHIIEDSFDHRSTIQQTTTTAWSSRRHRNSLGSLSAKRVALRPHVTSLPSLLEEELPANPL